MIKKFFSKIINKIIFRIILLLSILISICLGIYESINYRKAMFKVNGHYQPIFILKKEENIPNSQYMFYKFIYTIKVNQGIDPIIAYMFTANVIKKDALNNVDISKLRKKIKNFDHCDENTKNFLIKMEKDNNELIFTTPLLNYTKNVNNALETSLAHLQSLELDKTKKSRIKHKNIIKIIIPGCSKYKPSKDEIELIGQTFPSQMKNEMKLFMKSGKNLLFVSYYPSFKELFLRSLFISILNFFKISISILILSFLILIVKKIYNWAITSSKF